MNDAHARWTGKVVIITGGASGIGRAVGTELARHGAIVTLADVDPRVCDVAGAIGANGRVVDVRDAAAVRALVDDTVTQHGRIDFMFNNAGIAVGGEAHLVDDATFQRVLDVNLSGVLHGVRTAYAVMLRQGFGHIVNTASVAGLVPLPLQLSYATSKFAVVGLSLALRTEAAAKGVRVSVVCPALVDTPIVKTVPMVGLDRARVFSQGVRPLDVNACARAIRRGVEGDQAIIVVTWSARALWWLWRISPWLALKAFAFAGRHVIASAGVSSSDGAVAQGVRDRGSVHGALPGDGEVARP